MSQINQLINRSKKMKNRKGFTLVELIVVIVIIGILAAIIIPRLSSFTDTAEKRAVVADAKTILTAASTLYADGGDSEVTNTNIGNLVNLSSGGAITSLSSSNGDIDFVYTLNGWKVTVSDGELGEAEK